MIAAATDLISHTLLRYYANNARVVERSDLLIVVHPDLWFRVEKERFQDPNHSPSMEPNLQFQGVAVVRSYDVKRDEVTIAVKNVLLQGFSP